MLNKRKHSCFIVAIFAAALVAYGFSVFYVEANLTSTILFGFYCSLALIGMILWKKWFPEHADKTWKEIMDENKAAGKEAGDAE
jgi:hypothetical protein